jgi:hypothetical protein
VSVFSIPAKETFTGFTLGPQLARWMESHLVHGPGDVRGEAYKLDMEKRAVLVRLYELLPPGSTTPEGRVTEGRRRFKRGGVSVRKGWAKTELGAAISAGELHHEAPVRFDHWAEEGEESSWLYLDGKGYERPYVYRKGEPVGRGVFDPYVPMVAYTEEQSEELAYGALQIMLGEGPLAGDFDIQNQQIILLGDHGQAVGKAVALATAPNSADGARTSFQLFDETHRLYLQKHIEAHQTMQANIPKRYAADAWTLEITTSFEPGAMSVAESTMEYARKVAAGKLKDSRLFFYHRQADDKHKIYDDKGEPVPAVMREAVLEASGPASVWTDVDAIVELALDPQTDRNYWERVWLNRPVQGNTQIFDINLVDQLAHKDWVIPTGEVIVLGFDGARTRDATALVATHLATGRQQLIALWENPGNIKDWEVPSDQVEQIVEECFSRWRVWRMYADPYRWETYVAAWVAKYSKRGKPQVFSWPTNVHKKMALSLKAYIASMRGREWSYDGDSKFREHLANARKADIHILDEDGNNLYVMRKERPDSPFKIDAAMAGCLSWEAYRDALAAGVNLKGPSRVPVSF